MIGAAVRSAIPIAGKIGNILPKAVVAAGKKGGEVAASKLGRPGVAKGIRNVAGGTAGYLRSGPGKFAQLEAALTGVATGIGTGDIGKGVQAAGLNLAGNTTLGVGLEAIANNPNMPENVRKAAGSELAQYAGQAVIGQVMQASRGPSAAAQTISAADHAALLQGQAAITNAQLQGVAGIGNTNNAAIATALNGVANANQTAASLMNNNLVVPNYNYTGIA